MQDMYARKAISKLENNFRVGEVCEINTNSIKVKFNKQVIDGILVLDSVNIELNRNVLCVFPCNCKPICIGLIKEKIL